VTDEISKAKKHCPRCDKDKIYDDFYVCKRSKDGRRTYCKLCSAEIRANSKEYRDEYNKSYFKKNKKKIHEVMKIYHDDHKDEIMEYHREYGRNLTRNRPEYNIFYRVKSRAKHRGILFNIELSDIIIPEFCPVLGIKIICSGEKPRPNSPSIDRIIPSLGYVRGNIRIISNRANTLKSDATVEEMELILLDLRRIA
jgi:hypothetical protein